MSKWGTADYAFERMLDDYTRGESDCLSEYEDAAGEKIDWYMDHTDEDDTFCEWICDHCDLSNVENDEEALDNELRRLMQDEVIRERFYDDMLPTVCQQLQEEDADHREAAREEYYEMLAEERRLEDM